MNMSANLVETNLKSLCLASHPQLPSSVPGARATKWKKRSLYLAWRVPLRLLHLAPPEAPEAFDFEGRWPSFLVKTSKPTETPPAGLSYV
jgi:hypothetical protein